VNTVNEELKIMKELRALFSNQQNSRAMKVLMVVFGMFTLLLIGLGGKLNFFLTSSSTLFLSISIGDDK